MIDSQVSQLLEIRRKVRYPLSVGYRLTWRTGVPRLEQGHKMRLDFCWSKLLAVRDNKAGRSVIAFYDKIGVKILKQICQTPRHVVRMISDL